MRLIGQAQNLQFLLHSSLKPEFFKRFVAVFKLYLPFRVKPKAAAQTQENWQKEKVMVVDVECFSIKLAKKERLRNKQTHTLETCVCDCAELSDSRNLKKNT